MCFYRSVLRIPWTGNVNNEDVLRDMETKKKSSFAQHQKEEVDISATYTKEKGLEHKTLKEKSID